ncbi:MAG TPA: phosphoenolpyruvate--protein phosphotransferase [Gammaproteobacteria bacterium]|nr:phosphoenolpyruvate--protein phosphotransferase [Gammaproteobacteria bacterium]
MGLVVDGISVSRGIAIGKAHLLRQDELEISRHTVPRLLIDEEITRFKIALGKARRQLQAIRDRIPRHTPADIASFIDTHLLMLEDAVLTEAPVEIIRDQQCNAEWAVKTQCEILVNVFEEMNDPYLRTRKDDINHVVDRILRNLVGPDAGMSGSQGHGAKNRIVIAEDVSPAEVLIMHHEGAAGIVTRFGGPNSHTAILARSLEIPAVVGAPHVQEYIRKNELVVLDGRQGSVLALPMSVELNYYRKRQREEKRRLQALKKIKDVPARTLDGVDVQLMANVEIPEDIPSIKKVRADGIGLYRTEMLFINRDRPPDEEEQFQVYRKIVRSMKGAPVTIRTLDLGADKTLQEVQRDHVVMTNPAMGLRAIRCCLKEPETFVTQIRAILRASAYGSVRMMIPMLSNLQELRQVMNLVEEEKKRLRSQRKAFDEAIRIGGMIEVPAAAMAANAFARRLDFLSIGTNDLIQYTLAVDRLDEEVNYLYDPLHPAILKLIRMTIMAGKKAGIPVSMCGEMAGDPRYTRLLLGMGLREFSAYPATLLEIKAIINASRIEMLEKYVKRILRAERQEDILTLVETLNSLH